MNYKGVGAVFCLISSILMSARYIAAAVFMSNTSSWNGELFNEALSYVGSPLTVAAIAALIAGIGFLGFGMIRDTDSKQR